MTKKQITKSEFQELSKVMDEIEIIRKYEIIPDNQVRNITNAEVEVKVEPKIVVKKEIVASLEPIPVFKPVERPKSQFCGECGAITQNGQKCSACKTQNPINEYDKLKLTKFYKEVDSQINLPRIVNIIELIGIPILLCFNWNILLFGSLISSISNIILLKIALKEKSLYGLFLIILTIFISFINVGFSYGWALQSKINTQPITYAFLLYLIALIKLANTYRKLYKSDELA